MATIQEIDRKCPQKTTTIEFKNAKMYFVMFKNACMKEQQ